MYVFQRRGRSRAVLIIFKGTLMETGKFSIAERTFDADFGEKAFTLYYEDKDTLVLATIKGLEKGKIQKLPSFNH